ncbi:MAG: hypothetical protein ACHREM_12230 [Polyangiales bacterium]
MANRRAFAGKGVTADTMMRPNVVVGRLVAGQRAGSYSLYAEINSQHLGGQDFYAATEGKAIKGAKAVVKTTAKELGVLHSCVVYKGETHCQDD